MPLVATAPLVEAFASFQGEGPQVGEATLFVRTAACPLRCTYCDTTESYRAPERAELRDLAGERVAVFENPAPLDELSAHAFALARRESMRWLSLTGGEPTLWPEFGRALFEGARAHSLRTHLETAGHDAEAFTAFLEDTDFVSLDWKLPTTLHGQRDPRDAELACVEAAVARGVALSVKAVLTPRVTDEEWSDMLTRLALHRARLTLVVQPVTPCLDEESAVTARELIARTREALAAGFDVRVLPQVHKQMGLA